MFLNQKLNKTATVSAIFFVISLLFAWSGDLFPWQRSYDSIGKAQYIRVRNGHFFELSSTTIKHGSLLGIEKNNNKKYAGTGKIEPGYEMLIGALSYAGIEFKNQLDLAILNYSIVWLSILFLSVVFYIISGNLLLVSMFFLLQIIFFKLNYLNLSGSLVDHHGLVYPATIFGFGFLVLLYEKFNLKNIKHIAFSCLLAAVTFAYISLVRNSIGYAFLIGFIIYILSQISIARDVNNIKKTFFILLCVAISYFCYKNVYVYTLAGFHKQTQISLKINKDIPEPTVHGVWHNAFIGLGYYKNSWGIKWHDLSGKKFAEAYYPKVIYNSDFYYEVMKKLYFKYLFENPYEYIINHLRKLIGLVNYTFGKLLVPFVFLFFLLWVKSKLFEFKRSDKKITLTPFFFPLLLLLSIPLMTHNGFASGFITLLFNVVLYYRIKLENSAGFS